MPMMRGFLFMSFGGYEWLVTGYEWSSSYFQMECNWKASPVAVMVPFSVKSST